MPHSLDHMIAQQNTQKPELDVSPIAIIERLNRASGAVEARLAETFTRHDIDASTFDVLATLLRSGAPFCLTPADLAREAKISSSAVAQRLNRLVKRGFVTREPHPDDGRSTMVALTNLGKQTVERVLPDHLATERKLLAGLSNDGLDILMRLLTHLEEAATS